MNFSKVTLMTLLVFAGLRAAAETTGREAQHQAHRQEMLDRLTTCVKTQTENQADLQASTLKKLAEAIAKRDADHAAKKAKREARRAEHEASGAGDGRRGPPPGGEGGPGHRGGHHGSPPSLVAGDTSPEANVISQCESTLRPPEGAGVGGKGRAQGGGVR